MNTINFDELKAELKKELTDWNANWEKKGFYTAGNYVDNPKAMAQNCPDEIIGSFMADKFGDDWQGDETAQDFYESVACGCRNNAQFDALERLANFEENNDDE